MSQAGWSGSTIMAAWTQVGIVFSGLAWGDPEGEWRPVSILFDCKLAIRSHQPSWSSCDRREVRCRGGWGHLSLNRFGRKRGL
jgi:hypothetical protein